MTPQEQKLLDDFLAQLAEVPEVQKDRAAAAAIEATFARQPNAAYLVVQRSLLQQQALDAAQAEIARLKAAATPAQAREDRPAFLDPNAWGRRSTPPAAAAGVPAASMAARAPGAAGGMGSFLGQAAAMAAGVAGGAFLFQGLQHLLQPAGGAATDAANAADGAGVGDTAQVDDTRHASDATHADDTTQVASANDDPGWDDAASDVDGGFDGGDFA